MLEIISAKFILISMSCCIDVSMEKPFNTIPVLGEDGKQLDDTGKRVVVNSIGGALRNVKGTVVHGPDIYWYRINTRVKANNPRGYSLRPCDMKTEPYWCVLLDGFLLNIKFMASELKFLE
jgi:hypothetical protein